MCWEASATASSNARRPARRAKGNPFKGNPFTPLNRVVADHIFRIVSERYERGAIIITSNKPFEAWGEMFADPILATAVLDRLVHHAHIIPIMGDSYRTKDRRPPSTPPAGARPRGGKPAAQVGAI
jgi:hypothetical protein